MTREEFLKQLIVKKFGNVKSFSDYIDVPYTTIRSILERGVGKAGIDNVLKICKGLNINPDQLTEEFDYNEYIAKTLSTMYALSGARQKKVYECAEEQLEEQQKEQNKRSDVTSLQTYKEEKAADNYGAVSAGTGEFLFGIERAETVYLPESDFPDEPFDYVLKINGDSMLPTYKDGEYIFVKSFSNGGHVRSGMLAIVLYESEVYFKKVYLKDECITLVSLNKEYADIVVTDPEHFKVLGKVVS